MLFVSESIVRAQQADLLRAAERQRMVAEARRARAAGRGRTEAGRPRQATLLGSLLGRLHPSTYARPCEPECGR